MANLTYLTLNGQTRGLISGGCYFMDSMGNLELHRINKSITGTSAYSLWNERVD